MQVAIEHALTILSWHENLSPEEVPPEYLWEDSEGLEQWWASIEEKRKSGEPISRSADTGNGDQGSDMTENDLARALKQM